MPEPRKVALVTGGAKRVGLAIASRLADIGYDVAITYMGSTAGAETFVATQQKLGRKAIAIKADLGDPRVATAEIHRRVIETFNRLDVLVNNASAFAAATLQMTDVDLIDRMNAIHVQSPLLLCQKFETNLRATRGHVVNMLDLLAEKPWPEYVAYCASKAALWNLTLSLARSLAPEVTVNGIAPGVVEWPDDYPPVERERYLKRVPLARPGSPADVAAAVEYLVTGGSYITGQILRLDGGRSIT